MPTHAERLTRRQALQYLSASAVGTVAYCAHAGTADEFPLWEISRGHGRAYLLGHTPPRAADWKDRHVEALLRGCGHLWNETNHRQAADEQDLIRRYGIAHGKDLQSGLDAGQRARLAAAAKAVGTSVAALAQFRPWLAAQALEGALFSAPPFDKRNADQVLIAEAQSLSIPVSSEFPTLADSARWLAQLTPSAETQYLMYITDEVLLGEKQGQRIYAAWDDGNAAPATAWMARMAARYPELYQEMTVARNRQWLPRVRTMLDAARPCMIVVGLYHLVGPDRMQAYLAANGLRVRQI